jgi:hypothetical protein
MAMSLMNGVRLHKSHSRPHIYGHWVSQLNDSLTNEFKAEKTIKNPHRIDH